MKFSYPEGATPPDDISSLKVVWVKTQEDLNHVEVENIAKAMSKYLLKSVNAPQEWFNIPFLQKIHRDMFSEVWNWAGKFRTTQTCPGVKLIVSAPFLLFLPVLNRSRTAALPS